MAKSCNKKPIFWHFKKIKQRTSKSFQKAIARFRNLYNYQLHHHLKLLFSKNHENFFLNKRLKRVLQIRLSSCKSVQSRSKIIKMPPLNCSTKENLKKGPAKFSNSVKRGGQNYFCTFPEYLSTLSMFYFLIQWDQFAFACLVTFWEKPCFYSDFEKEQVTKFTFFCFKLYWMNYIKLKTDSQNLRMG